MPEAGEDSTVRHPSRSDMKSRKDSCAPVKPVVFWLEYATKLYLVQLEAIYLCYLQRKKESGDF